jgi:hypothetical protein
MVKRDTETLLDFVTARAAATVRDSGDSSQPVLWFERVVRDELFGPLFDYWRSKLVEERLPSRSMVDPVEIPKLLSSIGLLDVMDGGNRFRIRLMGTWLCVMRGRDRTGGILDELLEGAYLEFLQDLFREVVWSRRPIFSDSVCSHRDQGHLQVTRLALPLSTNGRDVDMVMFADRFRARLMDHGVLGERVHLSPPYRAATITDVRELERIIY